MPPLLIAIALGAVIVAVVLTWVLLRRDPDFRG
mgnify:CR=1 FL=1